MRLLKIYLDINRPPKPFKFILRVCGCQSPLSHPCKLESEFMPLVSHRAVSLFYGFLSTRHQVAYRSSLVTHNMMKRDSSEDVIEDSEPERQRRREALCEQRRKDRAGKRHIPARDDSPIIEISDDESLRGSRQPTIIELSGAHLPVSACNPRISDAI